MKVDILSKEEMHRTRDISFTIQVEEAGRILKLSVVMIEEYDSTYKKYTYEIESFGWITDQKGIDLKNVEMKIEEYLIDNAEDILS